jgi:hypothetical protein
LLLLATRFSLLASLPKSTTGIEPVSIRACNPAADHRHRARARDQVGAAGLEPAKPGGAGFTARCVSRSATHPKSKDEGRRQKAESDAYIFCFILLPSSFILLLTRIFCFILPHSSFSSLASYGSRTRSNTSTGCHAIRYTNETHLPSTGRAGESNPRHDIHSVGCCHYTKLANTSAIATRSRAAPHVHAELCKAEEEGLEPSPPQTSGHV